LHGDKIITGKLLSSTVKNEKFKESQEFEEFKEGLGQGVLGSGVLVTSQRD